jgi:16S rRNA (guanine966-N2)-methyltransferase
MRVIAGTFRSRKLKSVTGRNTRPTPDRLRETLFNILQPRLEGAVFLDAYAGTGAVAIEALSRGASRIILIERNPAALEVIRENLASLNIKNEATVVRGSAAVLLPNYPCDIAFFDPPYELESDYRSVLEVLASSPCHLAIAQHASRFSLDDTYGALSNTRIVKQGDNSLSFFEPA